MCLGSLQKVFFQILVSDISDMIKDIVRLKPFQYVVINSVILLFIGFFHWYRNISFDVFWFLLGGVFGIYFIDVADGIVSMRPSPFRSVIFQILFAIISFFLITSSTSYFAIGLVLSSFIQMLLIQLDEWKRLRNLDSWYHMIDVNVGPSIQRNILAGFFVLLGVQILLFI